MSNSIMNEGNINIILISKERDIVYEYTLNFHCIYANTAHIEDYIEFEDFPRSIHFHSKVSYAVLNISRSH